MSRAKQKIREDFNNECAKRDRYRCRMCLSQDCDHTIAHHITDRSKMPNGGYVKENGIILCETCHWKAEKFHSTDGRDWEVGFHPDDLYRKIGSSKEKALAAALGDDYLVKPIVKQKYLGEGLDIRQIFLDNSLDSEEKLE